MSSRGVTWLKERSHRLIGVFGFVLVMAMAGRIWLLQGLADRFLGCRWCVTPLAFKADLPVLAAVFWLFLASFLRSSFWWFFPLRTLAVAVLAFYLVDVAVTAEFSTRLLIGDIVVYAGQPDIVWGYLGSFAWHELLMAGVFVMVVVFLTVSPPTVVVSKRIVASVGAITLLLIIAAEAAITSPRYVHGWVIENVVAANQEPGAARAYSQGYLQRWRETLGKGKEHNCVTGRNQKENIVVLVLESWSPYHSRFWSGLNNWTPRLDGLARENVALYQFYAGGHNTNRGLVSLLTGRDFVLPIKPPREVEAFETAWNPARSLPESLKSQGYKTAFLTSGNLAFVHKGEWLKNIGFEHVEGHEHAAYRGEERLHFDAAPDDALYARALEYIHQHRQKARPDLVVVETTSTHGPYVQPHTRERSEEAVVRYMDETASSFIRSLRAQGFFDDGMLLVVSDHRAMTMISTEEIRRFGRSAASRIPAFLITGHAERKVVDEPFHQADVMPTLLTHVKAEHCHEGAVRDFLDPEASDSRCLLHARGDDREQVDVFCGSGNGTVRVEGDESRFIASKRMSAEQRERVLARIAIERFGAKAQ